MCKKSPIKIIGIIFMVILAVLSFGVVTMLLWNWLIPTIFNGPSVTYFQALGLLVLSKILLSSGPGKHERPSHSYSHKLPWKKHLWERMEEGSDPEQTKNSPEVDSVKETE